MDRLLLSVLLKECGVQKDASWVVSEGSEEVKGAGSIRLAKAMDDCIVAYGKTESRYARSKVFRCAWWFRDSKGFTTPNGCGGSRSWTATT